MSSTVTFTIYLSIYLEKKQFMIFTIDDNKFWFIVTIISLQFFLTNSIKGYTKYPNKSSMMSIIFLLPATFYGIYFFHLYVMGLIPKAAGSM